MVERLVLLLQVEGPLPDDMTLLVVTCTS